MLPLHAPPWNHSTDDISTPFVGRAVVGTAVRRTAHLHERTEPSVEVIRSRWAG
ncbi:hypothetical protein [Frankia sp. CgMI4]|uniref:hypothetical protein n=1 Tax=Frankia sp. CgMI4 TaxID=1742262 RepID=UPI00158617BE|nr:hypothetical protein [Frankia sp. CgIM4]